MILAAISFSDPVMLAGLAAAGIPVVLHLLNRIRSPIVMFPTLRFLKITAQKTSRRRQVQQYLLLLVRMAVFAMIAMAISRPLIRGGSSGLAYGFVVMFLVGMGLLVMAGIWGAAAVERRQGEGETGRQGDKGRAVVGERRRYWGLSAAALLLAILCAGYSAFGLTSDRYFSGDRGEFTRRATAAVVVLDNSQSMLAREDGASRLQRAKEQVRQMLGEKIVPAEAAVLATNPPWGQAAADGLTTDLTRLLGSVEKLGSTGKARAMQDRIRTAAAMLENSSQPSKLLIVISDFARPAFEDAAVFAGIKEAGGGAGAKDMQVVLMPMGKGSPPADVGIASFTVAEGGGHPVVGSEMTFEAQVVNNGDAGVVKDLVFEVDDQAVESVRPRVTLGAGGTGSARATIRMAYRLTKAGAHRFTLRIADAQDAVDWNNQRQLVLNVAEQMRVLVIGPEAKIRARSAAFYMDAALSPFASGGGVKDASGKTVGWSIAPTYRGIDDMKDGGAFGGYGAVFVCDVPRISDAVADGLAKYVKSGGRVVWVLGPSVDGAAYNETLLGKGRELLPGTLGAPLVSPMGSTVDWVDLKSDVFANLFESQEPFRTVVVTGRWGLSGGQVRGRALGKLADGSVIITQNGQSSEGGGDVYTVLTSPSAAWSNFGATVLLVPMVSRMALGDSGKARGETSFVTGEGLHIPVTGNRGGAEGDRGLGGMAIDVKTPTEGVINVRPQKLGEIPTWWFDRTQVEGVYTWRGSDGKHAGVFVVNPPGEEVELLPADVEALARETGTNRPTIVAGSASELLGKLEKQSEGTTLAPGVLAMVLMLAVIEALMANRYRPAARGVETAAKAPPAQPAASAAAA